MDNSAPIKKYRVIWGEGLISEPVTEEVLARYIDSGTITPATLVKDEQKQTTAPASEYVFLNPIAASIEQEPPAVAPPPAEAPVMYEVTRPDGSKVICDAKRLANLVAVGSIDEKCGIRSRADNQFYTLAQLPFLKDVLRKIELDKALAPAPATTEEGSRKEGRRIAVGLTVLVGSMVVLMIVVAQCGHLANAPVDSPLSPTPYRPTPKPAPTPSPRKLRQIALQEANTLVTGGYYDQAITKFESLVTNHSNTDEGREAKRLLKRTRRKAEAVAEEKRQIERRAEREETERQTAIARQQAIDDEAIAAVKARLSRDYPDSYATQKMLLDAEIEAYEYMKTVPNDNVKERLMRDYPDSFATQKMLYESEMEAKGQLGQ